MPSDQPHSGDTTPYQLYKKHGDGAAYRVAMLGHGFVWPAAPDQRPKTSGKRISLCGLLHRSDWSEWHQYLPDGERAYEGRWCRVCANTVARWIDRA